PAAMEPGRDDREEFPARSRYVTDSSPQWSPVATTGKSSITGPRPRASQPPQWSPVATTGKSPLVGVGAVGAGVAAMEPGRDDRERSAPPAAPPPGGRRRNGARSRRPGRGVAVDVARGPGPAAMEPGRDDREERCER